MNTPVPEQFGSRTEALAKFCFNLWTLHWVMNMTFGISLLWTQIWPTSLLWHWLWLPVEIVVTDRPLHIYCEILLVHTVVYIIIQSSIPQKKVQSKHHGKKKVMRENEVDKNVQSNNECYKRVGNKNGNEKVLKKTAISLK